MSEKSNLLDALDVLDNAISCREMYIADALRDAMQAARFREMGGVISAGLALICDAYAVSALRDARRAIEFLPACSGLRGSCEIPNCGDFMDI